jgi:hypothetical protein
MRLSDERVVDLLRTSVVVTREDVARAKLFVMERIGADVRPLHEEPYHAIRPIAETWECSEGAALKIHLNYASDTEDRVKDVGRQFALHLGCAEAVWELISTGDLRPSGELETWSPSVGYSNGGYSGGVGDLVWLRARYPRTVATSRVNDSIRAPQDIDLLLAGELPGLIAGVRAALRLASECLRRGLYLPSIAMLGSAAEAQWIECGLAALNGESTATKTLATLNNQYAGFAKKVADLCNYLNGPGVHVRDAHAVRSADLVEAQAWTTVLREHRNAVHWGKGQSFTKSYGQAATLVLAAPIHLATLERLRP